MCDPIASAGASTGLSAISGFSQYGQARAMDAYNEELSARNSELARKSAFNQYESISDQQMTETERAARDIKQIASDARRAKSRIGVAAAEAGVKGISVDQLIDDFERTEMDNVMAVTRQEEIVARRADLSRRNARLNLESNLISAAPPPKQANLFQTALGVFATGLSNFNQAGAFASSPDPTATVGGGTGTDPFTGGTVQPWSPYAVP